jgi:hypothetical protein
MNDEKIIDKIRKILAKSGNNSSQAEAQSALLKAQELLAKNGLTMEDIKVKTHQDPVVKEIIKRGRVTWWQSRMGVILSNNFRCECYISSGSGLIIMGRQGDVEIARVLYEYALSFIDYQTQKLRGKFRKQGLPTDGIMNDYCVGFMDGLKEKFTSQVENMGFGLILVKDSELVQMYNNLNLKTIKHSFKRSGNEEAYGTGFNHGKAFDKPEALLK